MPGVMRLLISLTDQSFGATKSPGIFNVSLGLARAFMRRTDLELHLLGNSEWREALGALPPHAVMHGDRRPVPSGWRRVIWDQAGVVRAIGKIRPDWALFPKGFPPLLPLSSPVKLACYVHDIIWEYYESLSPEERNRSGTPFPMMQKLYFRRLALHALRHADLVLTSTQFNRERFLAREPKARVAPVGIGFSPAAEHAGGEGKDLLLFVSPFPHKLTRQAVAWLARWLDTPEADGVRVHAVGRLPDDLRGALPASRWEEHGRMKEEELDDLKRRRCRAALYFSAYEGYGMPPVECLRMGLPCLASDIPPIRENVPERFLFPNDNYDLFAQKLNDVLARPETGDVPLYPSWDDVAERCLHAMRTHERPRFDNSPL